MGHGTKFLAALHVTDLNSSFSVHTGVPLQNIHPRDCRETYPELLPGHLVEVKVIQLVLLHGLSNKTLSSSAIEL